MKKKSIIILTFISTIFFIACGKNDAPPPPNATPIPVPPPTFVTPSITSFSPLSAFLGDTITISGQHLTADLNHLIIKFGMVQAEVVNVSETVASVIVPQSIEHSVKIKFITPATEAESNTYFQLKAPVIRSLSVTSGFEGQDIIAYGKGFSGIRYGQKVSFGSDTLSDQIVSQNPHTQFNVEIPYHAKAGKYLISVKVDGVSAISPTSFEVLVPTITSITTHAGSQGTIMTITGTNLKDANGAATEVYFNYNADKMGFPVSPFLVTADKLELIMPANRPNNYDINVWILKSRSNFIPFTVTK